MTNEIDASVESFFSKFDDAENNEINTSDSSTDTKEVSLEITEKKEDAKSESNESKEDNNVDENTPFHKHPRWQQKLESEKKLKESNKSLQEKFESLQKEINSLKNKPLTDEQLEGMTPKEIMEYTKKQMESEFNQKQELSTKEKEDADQYIDESLQNLKDDWHEFDENTLLTYAEKYTQWDIEKAFELYQKLETAEKQGAEKEAINSEKKKQAESNTSNRWKTWKTSWYVRWTSWSNLDLK